MTDNDALETARQAYAARQEARRNRMKSRAERLEADGTARLDYARKMADLIPFGQPILTDHYSAKGHRRDLDKIHTNQGKGFAALDEAERLKERAAAVGSGGIASDDPDAVAKLKAEVAKLEELQTRMKAGNAAIRKNLKNGREAKITALIEAGFTEKQAMDLTEPGQFGGEGFASYRLTNNNASINRLKKRIEQLAGHDVTAEINYEGEGWSITLDDGRLVLAFDQRQPDEVRALFRGWQWSPRRKAFVRKDTPNARRDAARLAETLPGVVV